jgi:hypothetical protein
MRQRRGRYRDRLHAHELLVDNRLECQFTALREFALNGTDHATHREQNSMIRYIAWRNRHTAGPACAGSSNGQPQPDRALATE